MNRTQLDNFVKLVNVGSFSKAEASLNITKTALKRQIDLLEEELGFILFERTSAGLTLTPQGKLYFDTVTKLLDTHDRLVIECKKKSSPRNDIRLRIGLTFTQYCFNIIHETQKTTGFAFDIVMLDPNNRSQGLKMLIDDQIDFLEGENNMKYAGMGLRFQGLVKDNMAALMADDHRLSTNRTLCLDDLTNETVYYGVSNTDAESELVRRAIKAGTSLEYRPVCTTEVVNACNNGAIYILSQAFAESFSPLRSIQISPEIPFRWGLIYKPKNEIFSRLIKIHAKDRWA